MTYISTITQKGQVTIPYKKVAFHRISVTVRISSAKNFLSLKGSIKRKFTDKDSDQILSSFISQEYEKKAKFLVDTNVLIRYLTI